MLTEFFPHNYFSSYTYVFCKYVIYWESVILGSKWAFGLVSRSNVYWKKCFLPRRARKAHINLIDAVYTNVYIEDVVDHSWGRWPLVGPLTTHGAVDHSWGRWPLVYIRVLQNIDLPQKSVNFHVRGNFSIYWYSSNTHMFCKIWIYLKNRWIFMFAEFFPYTNFPRIHTCFAKYGSSSKIGDYSC